MNPIVCKVLQDSLTVHQQLLGDDRWVTVLDQIVEVSVRSLEGGGKVLFAGNGGSAADAQHLAAELSGRFYYDRPPLASEALHCNTSYLTAVANDYSYEEIYSRLIAGSGKKGDVLVCLSTSGNSKNLLRAMNKAREVGLVTVAMTGSHGGVMAPLADYWLAAPTQDTPRVQEVHILMGHTYCQLVEARMFPRGS